MSETDRHGDSGNRPITGLAALLFVEICDFDRALAQNEKSAIALLGRYRAAVDPVLAEHGGEPVDVTGSELLVVFGSAVAAVQCALHLALAVRPAMDQDSAHGVRMGLHLGEIWRDENRVYGNGVNVAARVMQAAAPGSVLLSEDVYRQVATKLDLSGRRTGALPLKNIARSIDIFEADTGSGFLTGLAGEGARPEPRSAPAQALEALVPPEAPVPPEPPEPPEPDAGNMELDLSGLSALRELSSLSELSKLSNLTITLGKGKKAPYEPEAARAKAARDIQGAVQKLFISGGMGSALVYGYLRTHNVWFAIGAGIAGLLPFLSALGALFKAGAEIRAADRALDRQAGKRSR